VKSVGAEACVTQSFECGAEGAKALAEAVIQKCNQTSEIRFAYDLNDTLQNKIKKVAKKIYGASDVVMEEAATKKLEIIKKNKFNKLPVVIAKTQYSFSDNKELVGAPTNFKITIRDFKICSGAGFVVAIAGNMLLMPGLAKHSAYENMFIDENGIVSGLS